MFNSNPCIYLDNSATSRFKPRSVISAVEKELKRSANSGRASHGESLRALLKIEECRDKVRALTGMNEVVFTKSATEALNLAIFGSYHKGEIITSVYEHNSVLRPIEKLKDKGATVVYLETKNDLITPQDLRRRINKNTTLVVLQEMSNVNGNIQDIESLGKLLAEYGIPFIVDCSQSMGHLKTNYKGVTMLASPAHKGLHGVQGTGFLAFSGSVKLSPLIYGGTGTDSDKLTQPETIPEGYEAGTLNTPGIAGLKEGIKYTEKHFNQINKKIKELSLELIEELKKMKNIKLYTNNLNGVIAFNVGDMPSTEVADYLDQKHNICVRAGLHCAPLYHKKLGTLRQGAVRVSFGVNNSRKEVEKVIQALRTLG
ncbi:MAG: aminotransferase class V-fold PLP-dependent enzyme [Clostridia bacterium]|nr:aminotransferase class V-fold PLP-dependent enzyme [Clostridia bacterium]